MTLPGLNADQTSDLCHVVAIAYAIALAVRSIVWKLPPAVGDLGLVGVLFSGGIVNSRINGTPGA